MLSDDDLLSVLKEECAEVIVAASKATRFGMLDVNPNKADAATNAFEIALEFVQIADAVNEIVARYGLDIAYARAESERRAEAQRRRGISFRYAQPTVGDDVKAGS